MRRMLVCLAVLLMILSCQRIVSAQSPSGSAYQDISTTNNPGGRLINLMLRINF